MRKSEIVGSVCHNVAKLGGVEAAEVEELISDLRNMADTAKLRAVSECAKKGNTEEAVAMARIIDGAHAFFGDSPADHEDFYAGLPKDMLRQVNPEHYRERCS